MGRQIDAKHRIWIRTRAEELLKTGLTKVKIAERLCIHVSTLCQILKEDGRTVKRKECNNV